MADTSYDLNNPDGRSLPIKLVDQTDGTYALATSGTAAAGGATSAKQDTGNTSLAAIDANAGATADAAATAGAAGTVSAKLRLVTTQLNTLAGYLDGVETALASLALESGGNLAAAAASLAIIDNWQESDRAKVNPIVGQAGVAAGAGAVGATVPRMTLASDDPLVAVAGATTGSGIITDAAGTMQQYLRGLVKLFITAGSALVTATLAAGSAVIGAVTQSGTWTVQPGNTANTTAWKVDGSAVTQPVSAASLPLPTSAATSANQSTGNTSLSNVDTNAGTTTDAAATAGSTGTIAAKLRAISRDLVANIVLAAGANVIGKVSVDQTTPGTTDRVTAGGKTVSIDANFTRPSDTTAYAANDAVTTSTSAPTVITLTSMARLSGGSGVILDAVLVDESNPGTVGSFDLMIYDTTFTPNNDNAAFNPSTTIQRTFVGKISFSTQIVCGTTSQAYHANGVNLAFLCAGSANLFAELVVRNAYTPANAGRFDLRLKVLQD